jgi:fructose 1,6-bisphosphate aldolase/phosphatase
MKTTISIFSAGIGSFPGPSRTHPRLLEEAAKALKEREGGLLLDSFVTHCEDDLELVMTHAKGVDNEEIHRLAHDIFLKCAGIAKGMKLYGADQDLVSDAFSGNVRGMGPGVAEMEFEERESDPVLLFMAGKTEPGAWNFYLYRTFADPFTTPGLVIDPSMHDGFVFEVHDLLERRKVFFRTPEESYDLLAHIGAPSRFVVKHVFSRGGVIAASTSTQRLNLLAGRYVGNDDPVMIVRAQAGFPAVGEILGTFTTPFLVAGGMRGSHRDPLMPVGVCDANCTTFDGPPRVICLGFQVSDGRLIGPADMFDDPGFDLVRSKCLQLAEMLRDHGPFEPHRLSLSEMESRTLPVVGRQLADRWEPLD